MGKKYLNLKAKLEMNFLIRISHQNSSVHVVPFVSCVVSGSEFSSNIFSLHIIYIPFEGRVPGQRKGPDLGQSSDGKQA